MKDIKNTESESELNPYLAEVLDILGIKHDPLKHMGGDYRKKIDLILKENEKAKRNKKLALYLINEVDAKYFYKLADFSEDSDIILSAIKQDASIYASLSSKMQRKTNFAQEALKSLVREKVSFIEVEKFLTRFFPDEKIFTQMFAFYKEYLKTVEYIFRTDIERQLIDIRKSSPHIYKEIFQKKLLEEQGKNISITQEFSQYFLEQVSLLGEIQDISPEQKNKKYLTLFQSYLMIPDAQMTEDLKVFFESIIKLIHLKTQKKESKETREDDEDTQDLDQINIADEDDLQERLDFCIPRCNYFISHDGACDIRLGNSVFLSLSADEISRINDTALKNYISGLATLGDLGLKFGLKHREQFFRICDVQPLVGEGLSDTKILKILNKIGKKIGVPERSFIEKNDDTEEKREIGCFNRLEEAIYQFRQIAASGKINDTRICDVANKGDKSIVEIALIQKGYFDAQGKGFLKISEW